MAGGGASRLRWAAVGARRLHEGAHVAKPVRTRATERGGGEGSHRRSARVLASPPAVTPHGQALKALGARLARRQWPRPRQDGVPRGLSDRTALDDRVDTEHGERRAHAAVGCAKGADEARRAPSWHRRGVGPPCPRGEVRPDRHDQSRWRAVLVRNSRQRVGCAFLPSSRAASARRGGHAEAAAVGEPTEVQLGAVARMKRELGRVLPRGFGGESRDIRDMDA